jgi:hypothetical protein
MGLKRISQRLILCPELPCEGVSSPVQRNCGQLGRDPRTRSGPPECPGGHPTKP